MLAGSKLMARFGPLHVLDEVRQDLGGLLSGFEREGLSVLGGMIADAAHRLANGDVIRVAGGVRNEADVAGDAADPEFAGEVARRERPADPLLAGGLAG